MIAIVKYHDIETGGKESLVIPDVKEPSAAHTDWATFKDTMERVVHSDNGNPIKIDCIELYEFKGMVPLVSDNDLPF